MIDFLSSTYENLRIAVAGSTSLLSVGVIVTGSITGNPFMIVAGSLFLANGLFSLADNAVVSRTIKRAMNELKDKIGELKDQADSFKTENDLLKLNVRTLETVSEQFSKENRELVINLEKSQEQITRLVEIRDQFQIELGTHKALLAQQKKSTTEIEGENILLRSNVKRLDHLQEEFSEKNVEFRSLVELQENKIKELGTLKDNYEYEISNLIHGNDLAKEREVELTSQVEKLRILYDNAKELVRNLTLAEETFGAVNVSLDKAESTVEHLDTIHAEYDTTLTSMTELVLGLTRSTFEEIDLNHDGEITKEEFKEYIQSKKSKIK